MYSHCTGPVLGMGPEMEPGSMAYPEFWKPVMSCVCVLRPVSAFCVLHYTDYMIKTDKLWELETLSYLKNDKSGI